MNPNLTVKDAPIMYTDIKLGDLFRVKKLSEATFQTFGHCEKKNDYSTWVDDIPRP